jgi:ribonuclease HI
LAADALRQSNSFQEIKFAHVPREKNTRADELVNRALDDQEKSG